MDQRQKNISPQTTGVVDNQITELSLTNPVDDGLAGCMPRSSRNWSRVKRKSLVQPYWMHGGITGFDCWGRAGQDVEGHIRSWIDAAKRHPPAAAGVKRKAGDITRQRRIQNTE